MGMRGLEKEKDDGISSSRFLEYSQKLRQKEQAKETTFKYRQMEWLGEGLQKWKQMQ